MTDLPISASAQVRISHVVGRDLAPDLPAPVVEVVGAVGGPHRAELHDELVVVEPRRRRNLDGVPERLEQLAGVLRGGDAVRVHRGVTDRGSWSADRDAQLPGVGADLVAVRPRRRRRVERGRRGTCPQSASSTAAVSRTVRLTQRSTTRNCEISLRSGPMRRATAGGLQPDEAAARRGDADRATAVVRVRDGHHAARDRGRGATGRATGRVAELPRVVGRPVRDRLGRRDEAELRRVRAADRHEAGVEVLLREVVGVRRPVARVLQELHALVVRLALDRARRGP